MSTLNAKANQAYYEAIEETDGWPYDSEKDAWEDGWERGYKAALAELASDAERTFKTIGRSAVPIEALNAFFEGVREGLGK